MTSANPDPSGPEETAADAERQARLDRLTLAVDAWSTFAGKGDAAATAAFLAAHEHLRDLLAPMLADDGEDGDEASAAAASAAPGKLGPGHLIGDHRILREVGRGGMGTVFEAEQISLRRRVALKLLHDHLTWSAKSIERFRREAAAAARLNHAGIAPIFEVGEWHGRHYFTMEFVDGVPLHEAMLRPRLGVRADLSRPAEAAELVARVADALQHAHEHGFVHRDVKPHNIMVCADGSVRLLDFGLVKQESVPHETMTHEFLGTPQYSSPEQVAGRRTGPASDVFALGIVLYELLAGRRPFAGDSAREVLQQIELGACEPLARAAPGVPRDLVTICHRAMEPVPAHRYATAGDLAADLRRFLRIEPILATPPGTVTRAVKWVRRHRLRVGLWTLTALLVAGTPTVIAVHEAGTRAVVERTNVDLAAAERVAFESIEQTLAMLEENLERHPDPVGYQGPRLAHVVHLCEEFLALRSVDDDRRLRTARAFRVIAAIQTRLEMLPEAAAANARARGVLDEIGPGVDERAVAVLRGQLLRQELRVRQLQAPGASDEAFRAAIAQWQAMVQRPDAALVDIVEFAETLVLRARALADLPQRRLEAEGLVQQALGLLTPERRAAAVAADTLALRANNALGHLQLWTGRNELAARTLADVLAHVDAEPANPMLGLERTLALAALGEAKQALGEADEAERLLRQSIDAARVQVLPYPG
ncbi:MAG: serine/threonine-protein kinase [Planctomycetota bacterium]